MALLWLNALITASAAMVWALWSRKWFMRRSPTLAALYAVAGVGSFIAAVGFVVVLVQGDPTASAVLARYSVPAAIGALALARLKELLRDEARARYAGRLLHDIEERVKNGGSE